MSTTSRQSAACTTGCRVAVASVALLILFVVMANAAEPTGVNAGQTARTIVLAPSDETQYELQAALINAIPGDIVELREGLYEFETELNVACDNLTIRGAGRAKTILSFKHQQAGSEGIFATGNAFVVEGLTVQNTVGNGIKVLGARDVTFRDVRVRWTGDPKATNGAYGIYPVECQNVLVENCVAIGASDAGIYVGQSRDVIVRGCRVERNVAGIEIENTLRADVHDNIATDNTAGILVFDLPGLTVTNGGNVRVFQNDVRKNNRINFASKGTIVATVPTGTGVMVIATDDVEIFSNTIENHQTCNVMVMSYLVTQRKINDPKYDPFPEGTAIRDNQFGTGGNHPAGDFLAMLVPVVGTPFPDIFYDGIVDVQKLKDGELPAELRLQITENGDASFANMDLGNFSVENVASGKYRIHRDLAPHQARLKPLAATNLRPHREASVNGNPAVAVYRAAPRQLSEWGLFEKDDDGHWRPQKELITYQLNTPLFSDYATKHRMIRLPPGMPMEWDDTQALEFPIGTVIAKTFAYPDNQDVHDDVTPNQRFIETRIELHLATGWYGYSYIWNVDQTDADLSLGGGVVDVTWTDERGTHSNHYQVPNANQCLSCHSQSGKFVPLGPTAGNLNVPARNQPVSQLAHWEQQGYLKNAPASSEWPRWPDFDDPHTGSLDERARTWLDVNCAHCHSPQGTARTSGLDLRLSQHEPAKFGVWKSPVAAGKGSGGHRYDIVPGKPEKSILMYRLETDEPGARMPNLSRSLVHPASNELIRNWIISLADESLP